MSLDYQTEEETQPDDAQSNQETVNYGQTPYYSIILITCIILVSFAQMGTNLEASIYLAGFDKIPFRQGQFWRIFTGASLHGGVMHLAFNSYALFVLGKLVELLSNRAHLAIVFLLSAIGGGLLSFAFMPNEISVGASGGVIGFLGYLTVYGYKRRKLLSNSFLKSMLFNVGFIGVIGVFVMPNVDNFGHLGGLLVGAIYGLFQIPSDLHKDPRETGQIVGSLGKVALAVFILTSIFSILLIFRIIEF